MKAFKCDVCANFFLPYSESKVKDTLIKNSIGFEYLASIKYIGGLLREEDAHWDLCPECQNELNKITKAFIDERRKAVPGP